MADLAAVSAAVRSYTPENPDAAAVVQDLLISAASGRPDGRFQFQRKLHLLKASLWQARLPGALPMLHVSVLQPISNWLCFCAWVCRCLLL